MGFLQIDIKDIIDILIVATLMFESFRLLKRSGAVNLFWGILAFVVAWWLAVYILKLEVTGAIFDRIISVGAIALIVIFQEEIRTFFYRVGSRFSFLEWGKRLDKNRKQYETMVHEIVRSCEHMSASKTGALIVIARDTDLSEYTDTGESLNAVVSARLIENIFWKNTPLHDGAVIIRNCIMDSAACILPVSKNQQIPTHYGLRHRAALGVTEHSDAIAVIVSEETGQISVAHNGEIHRVTLAELEISLTRS